MIQMCLLQHKPIEEEHVVEDVAIKFRNYRGNNGLNLKDKQLNKQSLNLCYIQYCIMWVYHG